MPKTREGMNQRRQEILNILNSGIRVESLDDLMDQLKVRGCPVTKSGPLSHLILKKHQGT
ncbi:MAG: hypothetical protein QOH06_5165 [Acidobacteriota bacterium]|jgi:hypothetical protein|nr:hypothetical protein [Acidobacteriota bacterium]